MDLLDDYKPMVTIEVLNEQIKQLTKKVEDGFTGVWARQDATNGNIIANRIRVEELEKADIDIKASINSCKWTQKATWILITLLISVVLTLMGKYVY